MGEVINVVVAFAVIVFFFRWATKGGGGGGGDESQRRARDLLGFHPKNVTQDMISTVQTMFPDIPRDNIHYDLLRTGSVQTTSNKLLERGYLEAPPQPYFQLYPTQPAVVTAQPGTVSEQAAGTAAAASASSKPNLIARYNLEERLRVQGEDNEKSAEAAAPGGKAAWEDTAERREASLRERKAQMVLAARKRFLEQQQQQEAGA